MNKLPLAAGIATLLACLGSFAEPAPVPLTPPLGLPELTFPRQYPVTQDKVDLGRRLFFEERFSFSGKTACASCHRPEHAFAASTGAGFTSLGAPLQRDTPTILNAAYYDREFWDGRAASLEEQSQEVFHTTADFSIDLKQMVAQLAADPDYAARFQQVFGAAPTAGSFSQAITCYELTLLSGNTRFDRWKYGGEPTALTPAEQLGYQLFTGKGNCTACHAIGEKSALFMDQQYHNLGVGYQADGKLLDAGRYGVTGDRRDVGAFKTPQLRNVELTSPYMHDGSLQTLEQVVDFYDRGGHANPNLDPAMKPLKLTAAEKKGLAAFLKSLTDENYRSKPVKKVSNQLLP